MAAGVVHVEVASSCVLGRAGREALPERRSGNGATCPSYGAAFGPPALLQCQLTPQRLQETTGRPTLSACNKRGHIRWAGCCAAAMTPGAGGGVQVGQNRSLGGRQFLSSTPQERNKSHLHTDTTHVQLTAALLQAAVLGPLSWFQELLLEVEAAFTDAVAGVPLFARLPVGPAPCPVLAMAVVGDFGEVGPRRRNAGLRPRLKKQAAIEMEGQVQKALPNAMFQVALDNGCQVLAHISGKIRRNRIEIFQGDRVKVEISPYDLTRGRITHRNRRTGQGGPAPPGGSPGAPPGGAPAAA